MAVIDIARRFKWGNIRKDAWENLLTGLGRRERDKRLHSQVLEPPVNATEEIYEALYAGDDVAARAAELPAREMTRQWIDLTVDSQSTEDGGDTRTEDIEEASSVAKETMGLLEDIGAQAHTFDALVWSRVHGGALIQMIVNDGAESDQPLNEDRIQSFEGLRVWTRWQVRPTKFYSDADDLLTFGKPELYTVHRSDHPRSDGILQNTIIHESRFLRFDGAKTSPRRRRRQEGWSDSIYARLESVIRDYSTAHEGVAHMLQDWGQFVYKMKGLADMLAQEGGDKVILDRVMTIDMARSIVRAILLDADNEDAQRMGTPMSGLDGVLDRLAQRLAQAAEVPLTLLLGQSPAGLNATGESDIRFFYDQISAKQELILRPAFETLIRILFKSADGPTRGKEPDGWRITFNPLWQLTEEQQAGTRKTQAETDQIYITNGVITEDEVAFSRFGGDRYSSDTMLDLKAREERATAEEEVRASLEAEPMPEPEPEPEPETPPPVFDSEGYIRDDREASKVQTLIFDPDEFHQGQAKAWAKAHGFKAGKIDITGSGSVRLRQRDPGDFQEGSFRTIKITTGVQAVIGRPKE
jgi:phage-related protein (TIGR01555 family)